MIELSANTAMMLYLGLTLGILLGIWGYHHYRSRRKRIFTEEQELLVCEYCHFAYLDEITKSVTQCPQCQSFNKSNNYKKSSQ